MKKEKKKLNKQNKTQKFKFNLLKKWNRLQKF